VGVDSERSRGLLSKEVEDQRRSLSLAIPPGALIAPRSVILEYEFKSSPEVGLGILGGALREPLSQPLSPEKCLSLRSASPILTFLSTPFLCPVVSGSLKHHQLWDTPGLTHTQHRPGNPGS
jgi:hypothetical protein